MKKDLIEPKVSFIVTSYNYEEFIEQTLNSIKNQTYKNFEIIVVDDFSSDNSVEIIENFINKNQNIDIKLIKHDKNLGQLKSILTGLKNANGEFVSFIDSDDIIFENYAKTLLNTHKKVNVGFISCKHKYVNIKEKQFIQNISNKPFGGWFWDPMTSAMFKKNSVKIILNYNTPEDWRICPDKFIFNLVNLLDGSAILNKELIFKREHETNAGKNNRTKINFENNKKIRRLTLNFIKENKQKLFEKYGKFNVQKFIIKIYFSYFYIFIQVLQYVTKKLHVKKP